MREVVCFLSLGTDAYLEGGLAKLRWWAQREMQPITFVALDSLEEVNERALGHRARQVNDFLSLLEKVFAVGEFDFYLSSHLEADIRYRRYLVEITGIFQSSRSIRNLARTQTFRSMHRKLVGLGVKNQRHEIVDGLTDYVVRELSLLAYLASEFSVRKEISLHPMMPIRERSEALLPAGMSYPLFVAIAGGSQVSDLELEHLVIPVAEGQRTLGPLNVTVRAGSILGVVGSNGVGKSTLLKVIGGHLSAIGGSLKFGGRDITQSVSIDRGVASVFQDSALFPDKSLLENILVGERVASGKKREKLDYNDGHILGVFELSQRGKTRAAKLSGGEQQLGAIARSLSARPSILLLDEPGASIDQIRKRKALGLIREYVQQTAAVAVLVTHDPELIFSICDDLLVLSESGSQLHIGKAAAFVNGGGSITAAELIGLPNIFRCRLLPTGKVSVPDLGLELDGLQASTPIPVGLHLPPEAISTVARSPDLASANDLIVIKGRVQYRATVRGGETLLIKPDAASEGKRAHSLGRSTLLTVSGRAIELSDSNRIELLIRYEHAHWMGE